ncbi:MAG TPA: LptA/OstA family protein [Steroidobacteraceae bacterium]|nr:LptA/OstA family protein [Steroidobacteraceae bacterium]
MNLRLAFALLTACALLGPVAAGTGADTAATAPATTEKRNCDPANPATWPACNTGDLCLCVGGGGEYRRDKVLLNQFVIYQGGTPMRIQADHAEASALDFDNSTWTLTGAVSVRLAQGELAAASATVHFVDGKLSTATVSGAPATFEQLAGTVEHPGTAKNPTFGNAHGHAQSIAYDLAGGEVRFTGDAWLSNGCTELSYDTIVYNLVQNSVAAPGGAGGRVQGIIRPQCKPGMHAPGSAP